VATGTPPSPVASERRAALTGIRVQRQNQTPF
jgi:hypothetical protein